jgi:hypothetical protein
MSPPSMKPQTSNFQSLTEGKAVSVPFGGGFSRSGFRGRSEVLTGFVALICQAIGNGLGYVLNVLGFNTATTPYITPPPPVS